MQHRISAGKQVRLVMKMASRPGKVERMRDVEGMRGLVDNQSFCCYDKCMQYEWDEGKREANRIKHGLDFDEMADFQWESAVILADTRRDYREERKIAVGYIGTRLFLVVFTTRGDAIRIIGLRKANKREKAFYENKT